MADHNEDKPFCLKCEKGPPEVALKRCAKCSSAQYCSRECQKADWKAHKRICGKFNAAPSAETRKSPLQGLDQPITKPFTRLDNGTYLHDRPQVDVYRILIDTYRFRMEDDYVMEGLVYEDSLYGGDPNFGLSRFRLFLSLIANRTRLLPPWWNSEKKAECEKLAMDPSNWSCLQYAVEKSDIIEHYGDQLFPMQLRMLAEQVYCRGPGGCNGMQMRKLMVAMESKDNDLYKCAAVIDMTNMSLSFLRNSKK